MSQEQFIEFLRAAWPFAFTAVTTIGGIFLYYLKAREYHLRERELRLKIEELEAGRLAASAKGVETVIHFPILEEIERYVFRRKL